MKTINVPVKAQVSEESQVIFDQIQKKIGKVPNLYATIGYSAKALKGMLEYENTLGHGVFSAKEQEAIFLVVSEVNGCDYCLAAHTLSAIGKGFTKAETLDLRRGEIADSKLNAIIQLAKPITVNKGKAG
jgi:AhpD family alkylhydroperoxidase